MNKKYLPSALILYLNYFIHGVGCSILGQAVIKEALAASWGVEAMAITAISAALGLGRLIALPFAGPLSDKLGRRISTAIGSGSYANVYKYKDAFYNRPFILKRAKKELTDKEVARFKREFDVMNDLSSPYILEVYCYNPDKNEYIMEYMDDTLDGYIAAHNSTLTIIQRKGIAQQILRAFDYLHSKGHLHRDISPKNILIKEYDDTLVVKLSDFGLVKIPDSTLTTVNTEFKGYFNDPALIVEGFNTYSIVHETYALTRVIYFVMTGKTNTEKIMNQNLRSFVERGLNPDKAKRFQNIRDMISAFKTI